MPKKTEIDHYSDKEALDFHIKGKSANWDRFVKTTNN